MAVLDLDPILSIGAPSPNALTQCLKPLTMSTNGSGPVYLLNSRRVPSLSELDNMPPEAIERTDVLPESEGVRFGFPPTEGGCGTDDVEVNPARIHGPRRLSVGVSHLRLKPIFQSQREIVMDPDALYAIGGAVTDIDASSIHPDLTPLPGSATACRALTSSLASASTTAIGGIGAYRSGAAVRHRRRSATLASLIRKLDGSPNLFVEAQGGSGVNGLAPAVPQVTGGSGAQPFAATLVTKAVATGPLLRRPAGDAQMTVSGDYERSSSTASLGRAPSSSICCRRATHVIGTIHGPIRSHRYAKDLYGGSRRPGILPPSSLGGCPLLEGA